MLHERKYYEPRYQALFTCDERARLVALGKRYAAGAFTQDSAPLDLKRLFFARWLYLTGRIGEGVETARQQPYRKAAAR